MIAKGTAIGKAVRLIAQLNGTLDMERGGQIAANLRNLYLYMLERLTQANANNDPRLVAEVAALVRQDQERLGSDRRRTDDEPGAGTRGAATRVEISRELAAVAEGGDVRLAVSLDAERLQLLKSLPARAQAAERRRTGIVAGNRRN